MDYYYKEFTKLQEEFYEVMNKYPLFSETIRDIEEIDIKEINELLEKNDEYYLKKAVSNLKDLIKYVKNTSTRINREYEKFDTLAKTWEKMELKIIDQKELDLVNDQVTKANNLINSHNISDLTNANTIMEELIKKYK